MQGEMIIRSLSPFEGHELENHGERALQQSLL
jgi:hypothetical protein